VNIIDGETRIVSDAFEGCSSLQSINIPRGAYDKFAEMLPDDKDKLHEVDFSDKQ